MLVLIKDQIFGFNIGFGLSWQQLSWASLAMIGLWVVATVRAKREYQAVFRRTLERQDIAPEALRLSEADLSTIETLVEEQGHPDPRHVLYAIEMLESLNKRHLISPLLLNHESPAVRARALQTVEGATETLRQRWTPGVERLLKDDEAGGPRRGGACAGHRARRSSHRPDAPAPGRPGSAPGGHGRDGAGRPARNPDDVDAAEATLERLSSDSRPSAATARQEVAQALGAIAEPRFRRLLVPLMYDPQREVALEAIKSAGRLGGEDYIFVPPLVSLLRNRLLKASARQVLVGYGEGVIDTLAYFLRDPDEDIWVRRHIPSTLAQIPSQKTMNVLVDALGEGDGFLRFKVINALLRLKQSHPQFALPAERVQPLLVQESNRYFSYLSLHYNLVHKDPAAKESADCARALREARAHARSPVQAARPALSRGRTSRRRAGRSSTAMRA